MPWIIGLEMTLHTIHISFELAQKEQFKKKRIPWYIIHESNAIMTWFSTSRSQCFDFYSFSGLVSMA
jgi:hypothetical protein